MQDGSPNVCCQRLTFSSALSVRSFHSSFDANAEDALSKSKPPLLQALWQRTDGVSVPMSTKIALVANIDF